MTNKEKIVCSAIHYVNGNKYPHQPKNIVTGYVICGLRHHNCIATRAIFTYIKIDKLQGFLTSHDRFVGRPEALIIAIKAGQVDSTKVLMPGKLDSSDLY